MQHFRTVLPNGLRIVHVPMPSMRSVTVAVFVGVGSRSEELRAAGASHLVEHMLFKGTSRRRTATDISATLDAVGGILNASTDKETTVFWAKVASEHTALAIDLLADMLRNSRIGAADLSREKSVVLEELNMLVDDPQEWVHVLADELLWPGQAIGREVIGNRDSVCDMKRKDLITHLQCYYGPNNAVVSVAGGVEWDQLLDTVDRHFGGWVPVPNPKPAPSTSPNGHRRVQVEQKSTEQVNLCLVYPGVSRDHPDRWALDLLCTVLGGGTSSRLFVNLRERLALAYDAHAFPTYLSDTGSITIYAGTDSTKTQRLLDEILVQVSRLRHRRVAEAELQKFKQYVRGRLYLGLEDTHSIASWYGAHELLRRDVTTPEQVADALAAITADDILRVARIYLDPAEARVAIVGPAESLALTRAVAGA